MIRHRYGEDTADSIKNKMQMIKSEVNKAKGMDWIDKVFIN